jgi:hypothetical protein
MFYLCSLSPLYRIPPSARKANTMANVTYYVVLPFGAGDDGDIIAGEAQEVPSSHTALMRAEKAALTSGGAIAFSRTGDPATGEFENAVVLRVFGNVPAEFIAGLAG